MIPPSMRCGRRSRPVSWLPSSARCSSPSNSMRRSGCYQPLAPPSSGATDEGVVAAHLPGVCPLAAPGGSGRRRDRLPPGGRRQRPPGRPNGHVRRAHGRPGGAAPAASRAQPGRGAGPAGQRDGAASLRCGHLRRRLGRQPQQRPRPARPACHPGHPVRPQPAARPARLPDTLPAPGDGGGRRHGRRPLPHPRRPAGVRECRAGARGAGEPRRPRGPPRDAGDQLRLSDRAGGRSGTGRCRQGRLPLGGHHDPRLDPGRRRPLPRAPQLHGGIRARDLLGCGPRRAQLAPPHRGGQVPPATLMRVAFVCTQDRGGPVDLTVALARELAGRPGGPEVAVAGPRPVTSAGTVATYHGVPDGAAGCWVREGPLAGRRSAPGAAAVLTADALVARLTTATVTPSWAMASFLRQRLHVPSAKLYVIANGVALPPPRPPEGPVRTFVSVGTFAPAKAVSTLVDAFAAVARDRPGLRLLLVGDGEERHSCARRAAALGIDHLVEFTGYRVDVPDQLARADAFVLPSVNENLPLALIEAMGAGLACVASRVGGVAELLGGTGVLVRPGDPAALAAAMAALADEPALAPALGRAAAGAARRRFSIGACADAHLALWSRLVG